MFQVKRPNFLVNDLEKRNEKILALKTFSPYLLNSLFTQIGDHQSLIQSNVVFFYFRAYIRFEFDSRQKLHWVLNSMIII